MQMYSIGSTTACSWLAYPSYDLFMRQKPWIPSQLQFSDLVGNKSVTLCYNEIVTTTLNSHSGKGVFKLENYDSGITSFWLFWLIF